MDGATLRPGARNEKAPARFLSGRTSAMFKACVKGGRFVNDVFVFQAMAYAKARDQLDVTAPFRVRHRVGSSSRSSACTYAVRGAADRQLRTGHFDK